MSRRKKTGEIWVEAGIVSEADVQKALERQKGSGKRLGQVLEEMGIISEKDVAVALAQQFGFRTVSGIARHTFAPELLKLVDGEKALKLFIFPLKREEKVLYLAMSNPLDMETIDNLSFRTGLRIVPCISTPTEIQEAVRRHYLGEDTQKPEKGLDWWTILVVDDQELVRGAIVAALKRSGYHVMEAANGAEGVKAAFAQAPHLIISDTVMPRMDGIEMFRSLQSNPRTKNVPVIALSSKSSPEEEAKLLDMGYFDFVPKPINPIRLIARVKRVLRIAYSDAQKPPAR